MQLRLPWHCPRESVVAQFQTTDPQGVLCKVVTTPKSLPCCHCDCHIHFMVSGSESQEEKHPDHKNQGPPILFTEALTGNQPFSGRSLALGSFIILRQGRFTSWGSFFRYGWSRFILNRSDRGIGRR